MKMQSTSVAIASLAALFLSPAARAADDEKLERIDKSREVIQEFIGMPEGIPRDLVEKAECLAVIPSSKKFALGVGATFGKGVLVCRSNGGHGRWGAPLMLHTEGGSYGLQVGGQSADVVLLIMNRKGVDKLLESKLTLGADASVAAGPVGRKAAAATDAQMHAEILSYSRSRGVFAGVSLEGASVRPDKDANERLYGAQVNPRSLVLEGTGTVPPQARALVDTLQSLAPTHVSRK
jgi:lipid-binding SYLF domain-containing protein